MTAPIDTLRGLKAGAVALALAAVALFAFRTVPSRLWLDELYTVTLLKADSLPRLWEGIVLGIDGNPPLYLTLAWLIARAVPAFLSSVVVLKAVNVLVTAAALLALYRLGLRAASQTAAWIAVFLVAALNDNVLFVAFELRAYALYFLLAALCALFEQRLIERGRKRDFGALAVLYVALTLVHGFGILYVGCIALSGALSQWRRGWRAWLASLAATLPAIVVLACWMPFVIRQTQVVQPYSWITAPGVAELLQSLFSSPLCLLVMVAETFAVVAMVVMLIARQQGAAFHIMLRDDRRQPVRYLAWLMLGMLAITLTVWLESVVLFPLFVPRYFTPWLIGGFLLALAFGELLVGLVRRGVGDHRLFAVSSIVLPLMLLVLMLASTDPVREQIPCTTPSGDFFETGFVSGEWPVVADSPHVWFPRVTYAPHAAVYRFPLDRDVVLNYPNWARGNATDFNIMQRIARWAGVTAIMTTEDIVKTYPQFLVIESGRAWFHNLRQTRDVTTEKLAEFTDAAGHAGCTLWKVTSVRPRP
ncbi:hypothetical protein [Tardiphaga sp.]|uniref:hypothetical protein n=1 Tax=Tardiphaga sp. TaxID=1926292 RepID=UPI002628F8DC|nr:hypothetical protein [Tardiphaga sp.]MDB5616950.1 putative rane protein of unknown function [Tardiphaga sp.]